MSFVHSTLFWGGIGLVSIPIIIHLITRLRFRRVDWAAMEFLLEAMRRTRRRIRLEQLILLLLRIALVALIVLALARPHLSRDEFGWLSGPFQSEEKVFVVDDSLSMGHVESGRSAIERASDALLATVRRLTQAGGRDPVTILRASRYAHPLRNAMTVDAAALETLERDLGGESSTATSVRMDLAATIEDLATSTREERGRAVYILTDLCATDWTDGQGGPNTALVRAMRDLAAAAEESGGARNVRVVVVDVGPSRRDNLAITEFSVTTPGVVAGIEAELSIELTNFGAETVRNVGLRLRTVDSLTPGPHLAELAPGQSRSIPLPYTFHAVGPTWIQAEIDGSVDGLGADDLRRLVVDVVAEVEVLLVDGEPSGVPFEGETDFLLQALRPAGELASGLAPSIVVESNLPREGLDRFGVIFLANLPTIPPDFASALSRYVRDGGGLVIFPGDQVDPTLHQNALGIGTPQRPGADLLPASIGEITGDPNSPAHMEPDLTHPVFRNFAGGELPELFELVDVARFLRLEPLADARVIARLTDAERSPLLVERQVGKGRVLLFSIPADVEWTSWPRTPSFLPVLLDIVVSICRRSDEAWTRIAGAAIELPVDIARHRREALLRPPDYPAAPERTILAGREFGNGAGTEDGDRDAVRRDGFQFVVDDTRRGGIYTMTLKTVTGEAEIRLFALNADPRESDLRRVDPDALAGLFEGIDLTVIRDLEAALATGRGRFEIADGLFVLFLLFFFVEGTLAWWFAHHRRGAGALPESGGPR